MNFDSFIDVVGPRLRAGLYAAYGPDAGDDATAAAFAYAWENWDRVSAMDNPAGYLYRVGQTAARRSSPRRGFLPVPPAQVLPEFEPRLVPALELLTDQQRVCVVLVHAFGWSQVDAAELLEVDTSTVRTHLARALKKLRSALEVEPYV